eukprot:15101101-Alexandrium_andersonii.AAC.1
MGGPLLVGVADARCAALPTGLPSCRTPLGTGELPSAAPLGAGGSPSAGQSALQLARQAERPGAG